MRAVKVFAQSSQYAWVDARQVVDDDAAAAAAPAPVPVVADDWLFQVFVWVFECVCVCAVSVNCPNTAELDSARLAFNNIYALGLCAESTGHTIPIKLKHSTTASAQTHTHTSPTNTPIHTHKYRQTHSFTKCIFFVLFMWKVCRIRRILSKICQSQSCCSRSSREARKVTGKYYEKVL